MGFARGPGPTWSQRQVDRDVAQALSQPTPVRERLSTPSTEMRPTGAVALARGYIGMHAGLEATVLPHLARSSRRGRRTTIAGYAAREATAQRGIGRASARFNRVKAIHGPTSVPMDSRRGACHCGG